MRTWSSMGGLHSAYHWRLSITLRNKMAEEKRNATLRIENVQYTRIQKEHIPHTHSNTHKGTLQSKAFQDQLLKFSPESQYYQNAALFLWEKHTGYNESIDHQIVCRMNRNWGMISSLLCTDLVHILLALICKPVSSFYCPSFLSGRKKNPSASRSSVKSIYTGKKKQGERKVLFGCIWAYATSGFALI